MDNPAEGWVNSRTLVLAEPFRVELASGDETWT
jgi:hypothetical protein